jgi:multidrug efflux system outer membrane protein
MKKYIRNIALLLTISLIAACKVSKDTATPKIALPADFRNEQTLDSVSVGDISWESFFNDALLRILIDSAIVRNYDMQLADKNIEEARLLMKQAKWGYVPNLALQVTAGSTRYSDNSLNGLNINQYLGTRHVEDYTAALTLSWEADIWGKVRNQKRSSLAAYQQTSEAKKALQTRLVETIAEGYYNLLMLDAQMNIARKNLELNDSTLRIILLQYNAGQVTILAVQQAEVQRQVAAQLIPQFKQDILVQENALSILAGRLPAGIDRNTAIDNMVVPAPSSGIPAGMLARRPDVKSSELALTIANAQTGIAKANLFPTLSITASGGVNAFKATSWFSIPAALFGAVAGGIVQPLIQHRQLQTRYKISLVERERVVIRFRQTVLTAVGEVSDALARIEQLSDRYRIAAEKVTTLHTAIGNATLLFANGKATYLEVITAQANLLQSELELSTLKRAQLNASVDLYRSLGGGWQ